MQIVNIEEAKKEFIKFTENYDLTIDPIKRKQDHSLRVMELSTKLALEEKFSEKEIELATLIGLLHDIARFKQYSEYQTFSDAKSFDHGDIGVEILENNNCLSEFIKTREFDDIIKIAIKNHNKLAIEEGLNEEKSKFCKLIRDADKIDIIFQATEKFMGTEKEKMENSIVNPQIKERFDNKETIDKIMHPEIKYVDRLFQLLALIFDINYKSSFKILREQQYVEKILDKFEFKDKYTKEAMKDAKNQINEYICSKIS